MDNKPTQPEPKDAERERAKELVTLYKRFIAGYDNFESLHLAVADEFAAVREEERKSRDDDWNQELSGFCDENGTPFVDLPENPQEVGERWIPEIIDTLNSMTKAVLLSPGPCGKHPKACWRSISVCSAHQAVEAGCDCCNSGHCTECERETPMVKALEGLLIPKRYDWFCSDSLGKIRCPFCLEVQPISNEQRHLSDCPIPPAWAALKAWEGK